MARAAELDPYRDQATALDHLIWANARLGRRREAREAVKRREAIIALKGPADTDESRTRSGFLRLAYYARFVPWKATIGLAWRFRDPDPALLAATGEYVRLGLSFDVPRVQARLGAIMVRHAQAESVAAQGHQAQGLAMVLLGRPRAALTHFDSASRLFGTPAAALQSAQWRVLPRLLGLPAHDSATGAQGRTQLERLTEDSEVRARALWSLALAAVAGGREGEAESMTTTLAVLARDDSGAARLLTLLDAERAGRADSLEVALRRSHPLLVFDPVVRAGDPFARSLLYLRRAEWLERLGRLEDAKRTLWWADNSDVDGWAQHEAQTGDVDAALNALAWLRLAELEHQTGDSASACRRLRRVQEHWRDAEPEYRSLREAVARRLAECRG
jgi:hypothetical protein